MPAVIPQPNNGGGPTPLVPVSQYLFTGSNAPGYLRWFRKSELGFTELPAPSPLPSGTVRGLDVNRAGTRLAVAFDGGDGAAVYNIGNESLAESAIALSLAGDGECIAFSPDGNFIAIGLDAAPYLVIYRINEDNTLTACTFGSAPTTKVYAVAWSPDGLCLGVGESVLNSNTSLKMYTRILTTDTSFSARTLSSSGAVTDCRGVAWLNNNLVLYSSPASTSAEYLQAFNRSGTVFSRVLSNVDIAPTGNARRAAIKPGGGAFSVGVSAAPWLHTYTNNNGYLNRVTTGTQNTTGNIVNPVLSGVVTHCNYNADGSLLAVSAGADGANIYNGTHPVHGLVQNISGIGTVTDLVFWPKSEVA